MAKTLTIKDPVSGESYTLEYTRKTVEIMEKQLRTRTRRRAPPEPVENARQILRGD